MIGKDISFFLLFLLIIYILISIQFEKFFWDMDPLFNKEEIKQKPNDINEEFFEKNILISQLEKINTKKMIYIIIRKNKSHLRNKKIIKLIKSGYQKKFYYYETDLKSFNSAFSKYPLSICDNDGFYIVIMNKEKIILDKKYFNNLQIYDIMNFILLTVSNYQNSLNKQDSSFYLEMSYRAYLSKKFNLSLYYLQKAWKKNFTLKEKQAAFKLKKLINQKNSN